MTDNWNNQDEWETIEAPRGAYISWGSRVGQHVTGKVIDYDVTGGRDQKDNAVPLLSVELSERAASINKEGQRTDYNAGELVNLTVSQVSLKRNLRVADPQRGDKIKIMLANLVKTSNGTVKEFEVKIARGRKGNAQQPARQTEPERGFDERPADRDPWGTEAKVAASSGGNFDDEPPF